MSAVWKTVRRNKVLILGLFSALLVSVQSGADVEALVIVVVSFLQRQLAVPAEEVLLTHTADRAPRQ